VQKSLCGGKKMNSIKLALVGNPNVGKSVFFNQLTGGSQHVGNWPGKTVEKVEGSLRFLGRDIKVVDLPGINSLSTYSQEEEIAREYIEKSEADIVLNIVDVSALEKNLYMTLQLLEMNSNIVLAMNMKDVADKRGIKIDNERLSSKLGIPIVQTVAIHSQGIQDTMIKVVNQSTKNKKDLKNIKIRYSSKIEEAIDKISNEINSINSITKTKHKNSSNRLNRWLSINLLENDKISLDKFSKYNKLIRTVKREREKLERIYDQNINIIFSSERYRTISRILSDCQEMSNNKIPLTERLDDVLLHNIWGYLFLAVVLLSFFYSIFLFGDFFSGFFESTLTYITSLISFDNIILSFLWESISEGVIAGLVVAVPYLFPFYILLAILEDSGYLPRIAFLMDGLMHKIGLHGKSFIPIILGYGCSVPAISGTKIMESKKQQYITSFLVTLIPCAARSVIIFAVIGAFMGINIAMLFYVLNLLVVVILGFVASKIIKGKSPAMILNMPTYKMPQFKSIWIRAWFRIQNFVKMAFPIIIAATIVIKSLEFFNVLHLISDLISPITVGWLGLPSIVGIILITGILRKELIVLILAALLGTTDFGAVLTPIQMIVLTIISMFYIPCAATIAVLHKELGLKKALSITLFDIIFAILFAGLVRLLLINLPLF